jgi:hypothetical protein
MTLTEAAAARGLNRRSLNHAVLTGKVPGRRVGPVWVVRLEDVDAWLADAGHRPGPALVYRKEGT